jgi:hypothetical protein
MKMTVRAGYPMLIFIFSLALLFPGIYLDRGRGLIPAPA